MAEPSRMAGGVLLVLLLLLIALAVAGVARITADRRGQEHQEHEAVMRSYAERNRKIHVCEAGGGVPTMGFDGAPLNGFVCLRRDAVLPVEGRLY